MQPQKRPQQKYKRQPQIFFKDNLMKSNLYIFFLFYFLDIFYRVAIISNFQQIKWSAIRNFFFVNHNLPKCYADVRGGLAINFYFSLV